MSDSDDPGRYRPNSAVRYGGDGARAQTREKAGELRNALRLDGAAQRRVRFRKRTRMIMLAAFPLAISAFANLVSGAPLSMARDVGLFALFCFGALLIRQGVTEEEKYLERAYSSPPSLPRKLLGSLVLGSALTASALFGWYIGVFQSLALGVFGTAASVLSFGLDPMRSRGEITLSGVTPRMVEEAIAEAEDKIDAIDRAAADIRDAPLRERLSGVTMRSRDILRRIEDDPSDLRRARKFLKVYLDGALESTRKYVKNQDDHAGSETYLKFRSLLDDLNTTFDAQHEKLLANDKIDLDVEIEVLADRIKQEVVR